MSLPEWSIEIHGFRFKGVVSELLSPALFSVLAEVTLSEAVREYLEQPVVMLPDRRGLVLDQSGAWSNAEMEAEIQLYPEGVCAWVVGTQTLSIWGSCSRPADALRKILYWHSKRDGLIHTLHGIEKRLLASYPPEVSGQTEERIQTARPDSVAAPQT